MPSGDTTKKDYVSTHQDARPQQPASAYRAAGYIIDAKFKAGDVPTAYAADVLQPNSVHIYKP